MQLSELIVVSRVLQTTLTLGDEFSYLLFASGLLVGCLHLQAEGLKGLLAVLERDMLLQHFRGDQGARSKRVCNIIIGDNALRLVAPIIMHKTNS